MNRRLFRQVSCNGQVVDVTGDWSIESPLVNVFVGDEPVTVQYLDNLALGFRLSYLGTKVGKRACVRKTSVS